MAVTRSQIDKLGERLREHGQADESLLEQLQAFRAEFAMPLAHVHELVSQVLGLPLTGRIKTINTIVEKLVRAKTRLSTMQDIAGLRVVVAAGLRGQDEAVQRLRSVFAEARVDDLRDAPRVGYRAVHVIPLIDGRPVEIQVRTRLQDLWAQGMEGLADKVGRGIRYGEPPTAVLGGADVGEIVREALSWSESVRLRETIEVKMGILRAHIDEREGKAQDATLQALADIKLQLSDLSSTLTQAAADLHVGLELFVAAVKQL